MDVCRLVALTIATIIIITTIITAGMTIDISIYAAMIVAILIATAKAILGRLGLLRLRLLIYEPHRFLL